jgi:hypothetical protein
MVAVTGSLAVNNADEGKDIDYMLVTKPGYLWTCRAMTILVARIAKLEGVNLCPNYLITENAFALTARSLYTAHELVQMIPLSGREVYTEMRRLNAWTADYLPNAKGVPEGYVMLSTFASLNVNSAKHLYDRERDPHLHLRQVQASVAEERTLRVTCQSVFEFIFNLLFVQLFERWEMNRKIARFTKQDGYGTETGFSADVCQGNFDHHGARTEAALQERLHLTDIELLGLQVETKVA